MDKTRNRLLASLGPMDLALLAQHARHMRLDRGAVLQEQEVSVEHVYFPLSGAVSLLAVMQGGEGVETAIIGREGAVGLFADFGPWRACVRAVVQAPGIAEVVPLPQLRLAASQSETLRCTLLRYKEAVSAQAQQTAGCNALHSVEERMARWLLQLSDRIEHNELPVTQDTLSQLLGVRRTTVTLIAQKLQHDGLIRYRRGRIVIIDCTGLQALACECYATCRRRTEALFEDAHLARIG